MFIRTTAFGLFNQASGQMIDGQDIAFDIQNRVLNGDVKSMTLSGYGNNSLTILNYQTQNKQTDLYLSNNKQVDSIGKNYVQSLTDIQDAIDQAKKYITSMHPLDPSSPEMKKLQTRIDTLLKQVENAVNQKGADGSYIFSGGHTNPGAPAPMKDLTQLPLYGKDDLDVPFIPSMAPQLPTAHLVGPPASSYTYSNYGAPNGFDPISWQDRSSLISDDKTLQYGLTANDKGLQYAVDGLMRLKSLTNLGDDKDALDKASKIGMAELDAATNAITDMKTKLTFQMDANKSATDSNNLFQHYIQMNLAQITQEPSQQQMAGDIAVAQKSVQESQAFMQTIFQSMSFFGQELS